MDTVLYGNRESGHSYKVRLALLLAGLPFDYEEIDLDLARDARPEPFRSLSPFGEVPVLVHAGRAWVQSDAILLHLAEHTGRLGGESPARLAQVREWLFWEANRLGFSLPNLRYGLRWTGLAPDVEAMLRARFDADIARLDAELAAGGPFLLGEAPCVADLALCAYLYWPEQARVAVPAAVQAWLARIAELPGWRHPDDLPEPGQ